MVTTYDLIDLKVYLLTSGRNPQGLKHLDGIVLDHGEGFKEIGDLGIASVYGYKGEKEFVDGATIHIFRGRQHKDYDQDNPMIHPFCFENSERILDLGMKGGFCREEGIIFGKEYELHKKSKDKESYLKTWPFKIKLKSKRILL